MEETFSRYSENEYDAYKMKQLRAADSRIVTPRRTTYCYKAQGKVDDSNNSKYKNILVEPSALAGLIRTFNSFANCSGIEELKRLVGLTGRSRRALHCP